MRLTAALTASHVKEGQRVFVHGTVTYAENGVRKPEAGAKVLLCNIDTGYPCNGQVPSSTTNSTVTDAHGKFTMRVPSTGSTTWTVATLQSIYFHPAAVNRSLSVALRNAITNFKANVSSFAVVTYSGCVIAQPSGVVIEYAAKKTGPWRRLKIKPVDDGSLCTPGHSTRPRIFWHRHRPPGCRLLPGGVPGLAAVAAGGQPQRVPAEVPDEDHLLLGHAAERRQGRSHPGLLAGCGPKTGTAAGSRTVNDGCWWSSGTAAPGTGTGSSRRRARPAGSAAGSRSTPARGTSRSTTATRRISPARRRSSRPRRRPAGVAGFWPGLRVPRAEPPPLH